VQRPQLRRHPELGPTDVHEAHAPAPREAGLVPVGERQVARAERNDQDLEKGQARRDDLASAGGDVLEDRGDDRQERLVLLDVLDEDGGVERRRSGAEVFLQSHARRSASTWAVASVPLHASLPRPRSSRIDTGAARSTASSRIQVTSWATERRRSRARF
jgi:hypothetical protein